MSVPDLDGLRARIYGELAPWVQDVVAGLNTLRIVLVDESFVEVWYSLKLSGRYSYHWERSNIDGRIYRFDNAPHRDWRGVRTFPHHFHNGSEDNVIDSPMTGEPTQDMANFIGFMRQMLDKELMADDQGKLS